MFLRYTRRWYLFPIFLLFIGGIISYIVLRNKDPALARNTMLLGIALTAVLVSVGYAGTMYTGEYDASGNDSVGNAQDIISDTDAKNIADAKHYPAMTLDEIKEASLSVPYELLVEYGDAYVGDVIQYKGHVIGVIEDQDAGSYVLKIEMYDTDDRPFAQDRLVWSKYTPKTDDAREQIKRIAEDSWLFGTANSKNSINVWATMHGLRDFDIMFKTYKIPETEIVAFEMLAGGRSYGAVSDDGNEGRLPSVIYTVSVDPVPDYVDTATVTSAMQEAMQAWTDNNPSVIFETVAEDADLEISWKRYMGSNILGSYSQYNTTSSNGHTVTIHQIDILLGSEDCASTYRQFAHDALRYTIAHEIGHYLGLRHVDDPDSLMHSASWDTTDNIFTYRNLGYSIPEIDRGAYVFEAEAEIEAHLKQANLEMSNLIEKRASLKSTAGDEQGNTSALAANKDSINSLTRDISALEEEIACLDTRRGMWEYYSVLS